MIDVDIAVIGSGSGNSLLTDDLADRTFAMIEGGEVFGGTCLNVGCIPTKMFVHVAEIATAVREGGRLGVDATLQGVRYEDVRDRVFGRIDPISEGGRDYRRDVADPGINWTEEHTIKFTVRIDEDIVGGTTFDTALDRYQIYDSSAPVSNIDNTSAWAIEAFGASDGGAITSDMVGEWIFTYGDGTGANAGRVDSNIDLVMGGVYDFTIVVDPEDLVP